jgi:hypothetical protein
MLTISAGICLPSRSLVAAVCSCLLRVCCLPMNVVPLSVSRPLHRNECCFRAVRQQRLFLWLHSSCFEQICHNVIQLFCLFTCLLNNPKADCKDARAKQGQRVWFTQYYKFSKCIDAVIYVARNRYVYICLSVCLSVYGCTADRAPLNIDQPFARPLPTHRTTQTQNKRTQTSML